MRLFLGGVVACAFLAADVADPGVETRSSTASAARPNVVLIVTDDQRLDDVRWTPKTRSLLGAAQGVTFRNAITPNPVCCPTRAALLTGQHSHNNGVLATGSGRYGGLRAYTKGRRNPHNDVGRWMQSAGYRTAFIGKWLNGYNEQKGKALGESLGPRGWDFWDATVTGGVNYRRFTFANNGSPVAYRDSYTTRVATDRAVDRIRQWAGEEQPFFLSLFYAAPHKHQANGRQYPAQPEHRYRGTVSAPNPDAAKRAFNRVPSNSRFSGRSRVGRARMLRHFQARAEALRTVDDGVEQIVRELDAHGVLDNTLIIFTSDNGFSLGQHRWLGKRWPFTVEMRVPLLMRGPGVAAGATTRRWVTPVDLTATIVQAGGARPGRMLDGRSFLRAGGSSDNPARRAIPLETGNQDAHLTSDRKRLYRGLWYGRYIYVKHPRGPELYDLHKDPHQLINRAGWRAYRQVRTRMAEKSRQLGGCRGTRQCYAGRFWLPPPGR